MVQCTQGTQLNCFALNCVVLDASFLGGVTDMRTPPQHTHQYIRHKHHSSRRNTAEGKILQYGASHSQSTICLCWKHFKAVKGIDWSAPQQCNKKQGTLFGGKLIFFNSSSFQYNVLQLQYCVVSHIRWFFCSFLHFYFYSYRQAYFLRWQIVVFCVLCSLQNGWAPADPDQVWKHFRRQVIDGTRGQEGAHMVCIWTWQRVIDVTQQTLSTVSTVSTVFVETLKCVSQLLQLGERFWYITQQNLALPLQQNMRQLLQKIFIK